jgi:hypothetical protein
LFCCACILPRKFWICEYIVKAYASWLYWCMSTMYYASEGNVHRSYTCCSSLIFVFMPLLGIIVSLTLTYWMIESCRLSKPYTLYREHNPLLRWTKGWYYCYISLNNNYILQNVIRIYNLVRLFTLLPDFCEKFSLLFHFCQGFANDKMLSLF